RPGGVAQVVVTPAGGATERVGGPGLLAVVAVLDLGAVAERVDHRGDPAAGGGLEPPDGAVGVLPGLQRAVAVVAVGGAVAQRGDRGDHPTEIIALQAGGVALGVGGGDQLAVLIMLVPQRDADRVDDLLEQAALPPHPGDAALGVDHLRRIAGVALVAVAGDRLDRLALIIGAGHRDGDRAVLLVVVPVHPRPGRQHLLDPTAAVVVPVHGHRAVALGDRDRVAVPVVTGGLPVTVGVDHPDQPALAVRDPGVGSSAVGVGDLGHATGQVDEPGDPAERRALTGHPALLVVGVLGLDHPVGIDHGVDQVGVVPPVAPGPGRGVGR